MRTHVDEHAPYVALKSALAERHGIDRAVYTGGKGDFFWNPFVAQIDGRLPQVGSRRRAMPEYCVIER